MKWNKWLIGVLIVTIMLVPIKVVSIHDNNDLIYYSANLKEQSFDISYLHSVSNSMIREFYTIDGSGIYNIKSIFSDQGGAGMPDVLKNNEHLVYTDQGFELYKQDFFGNELRCFVNEGSQWVLNIENRKLNYTDVNKTRELIIKEERDIVVTYLFKKIRILINEN